MAVVAGEASATSGAAGKVLASAEMLFATSGFADVSLADLSTASGVSNGSIYHHFGSKDGILTQLLIGYATSLQQALLQVLDGHAEDAHLGVVRTVHAYLEWTEQNRRSAELLVEHGQSLRMGETRSELRELNARYLLRSAAWLERQAVAGRLPMVGVDVAHAVVFAPAREVCRLWLVDPDFAVPTSFSPALGEAAWAALRGLGQAGGLR